MRLFLLLLLSFSFHVQAIELNGLDAKIQTFLQTYQPAPDTGVAVGVVHKGQLVFFKGYGYRDRVLKLPVTEHTQFRIASNTKSFMSTTLAILSDEGRLTFDDSVRQHLPRFGLESEDVARQATLADLLSHRVGLPRHDAVWYMTPFTSAQLFEKLPYLEMNKAPGYGFRGKWQYNNLMFMSLGLVAEKAVGLTWDQVVRLRLLQPLAMMESGFSVEDMNKSPDFANPYSGDELLPSKGYEPVGAAGIMTSNVADLVKWVAMLSGGGKLPSGQQLVSLAAMTRMFTTESEDYIPSVDVHVRYGLGWFLDEIGGRKLVWHGGNIDGFSSLISFIPGEELGLIVLINQTNGNNLQLPWTVTQNGVAHKLMPVVIYEHLLNVGTPAPSAPAPDLSGLLSVPRLKQGFHFVPFDARVTSVGLGKFQERAYGDLEVFQDTTGILRLLYYGWDLPLKATPEVDKYVIDSADFAMPVEIIRNADGSIAEITVLMEPSVSPIRFKRVN